MLEYVVSSLLVTSVTPGRGVLGLITSSGKVVLFFSYQEFHSSSPELLSWWCDAPCFGVPSDYGSEERVAGESTCICAQTCALLDISLTSIASLGLGFGGENYYSNIPRLNSDIIYLALPML